MRKGNMSNTDDFRVKVIYHINELEDSTKHSYIPDWWSGDDVAFYKRVEDIGLKRGSEPTIEGQIILFLAQFYFEH